MSLDNKNLHYVVNYPNIRMRLNIESFLVGSICPSKFKMSEIVGLIASDIGIQCVNDNEWLSERTIEGHFHGYYASKPLIFTGEESSAINEYQLRVLGFRVYAATEGWRSFTWSVRSFGQIRPLLRCVFLSHPESRQVWYLSVVCLKGLRGSGARGGSTSLPPLSQAKLYDDANVDSE